MMEWGGPGRNVTPSRAAGGGSWSGTDRQESVVSSSRPVRVPSSLSPLPWGPSPSTTTDQNPSGTERPGVKGVHVSSVTDGSLTRYTLGHIRLDKESEGRVLSTEPEGRRCPSPGR